MWCTHPGFLDFSQFRRASLLKAAVAALLLLFLWMLAMVSEFFTTSMRPVLFPVDKQPYGIILTHTNKTKTKFQTVSLIRMGNTNWNSSQSQNIYLWLRLMWHYMWLQQNMTKEHKWKVGHQICAKTKKSVSFTRHWHKWKVVRLNTGILNLINLNSCQLCSDICCSWCYQPKVQPFCLP